MAVFDHESYNNHEGVYFKKLPCGVECIVAIHNTKLGPALGGTRMWVYENYDDALHDVLRLSEGMTYKNAMAGLPFGGGKAVVIGDSKTQKTRQMLLEYGEFIESLGGAYLTAEDMGMTVQDMDVLREVTDYAHGLPDKAGNPAPATSYGTYCGIKAAVKHKLGLDSLSGLKIAVMGVGSVGTELCERLHADGAEIFVTDINMDAVNNVVEKYNATFVQTDIHKLDVDVFSPCAMGAILNENTIPEIKAPIVAGCANNQLSVVDMGKMLHDKGILYAPDYVINAGGVIDVAIECVDGSYDDLMDKVGKIYDTLLDIFKESSEIDVPTNIIADIRAKELIQR